ncbi:hypothetical protein [Bradyrhizobium sp. CCBAU 45384]|uniref:hypothetical protein n=1 Tax=Bradyrhizobium sp. CCBAU 45384 TaxID=858428 RepID=UPI002306D08C|nr:hypothetical protein [Bradyrhizobium sp. CCBAU 45384]MDA9409911.1 hypothetical protein [Bradyrhizobium sp. CCBAU 45384]
MNSIMLPLSTSINVPPKEAPVTKPRPTVSVGLAVVQRLIPITARAYLRALALASACSVVLITVWELADAVLKSMASELMIAAAASAVGAAAYLVTLKVTWPDDFRQQLEFTRLILRGDRR